MQHKKAPRSTVLSACWTGFYQHSQADKLQSSPGIKQPFSLTGRLVALLLISGCASNLQQQKPAPQPTQNKQESTSEQRQQSTSNQAETNPASQSSSSSESSTTASDNPADLNEELSESLGTFDEILLNEQQKIDNNRPFDSSQEQTGSDSEQDSDGLMTESSAATPDESTQTGETEKSSEQPTTTAPPGTTQKSSGNNQGVDGDDDDIVARQLREAAEKEPDPELKAKLWEEYYRYKQQNPTE